MPKYNKENAQNIGLENMQQVLRQMETLRAQVAGIYVTVDSDAYPVVEQEIGDVLTSMRAACKRMRKAVANLAQEALPGFGPDEAA